MGLTAGLFMGAQALAVSRVGIEVAGHNISNVNTANFARQRVNLQTDVASNTSVGPQGHGVIALEIQQLRNFLLDSQMPGNISNEQYLDQKSKLMAQVTSNIGQTVDNVESLAGTTVTTTTDGLQEAFDAFYNAFESLSADPTSSVLRQQVVLGSDAVARKLNTISDNLSTLQGQILNQADQNLTDINDELANVADLNRQIYNMELGGAYTANDLRDSRQRAIEELSGKIDLYTQEEANGTLTVRLHGSTGALLVSKFDSGSSATSSTYALSRGGTVPTTAVYGATGGGAAALLAVQPDKGTLSAQLEVANSIGTSGALVADRSGMLGQYDNIASSFAGLVNAQHALGYTLQNPPYYDVAGTDHYFVDDVAALNITAANITLSSAISSNQNLIAASDTPGNTALATLGQPNNGDNALLIARLRDSTAGATTGGQTIQSYYLGNLTALGSSLRSNDSQLSTQQVVNQELEKQRNSVMGVSVDEEMADLIRFQQSYAASARFISTIQSMFDSIMAIR